MGLITDEARGWAQQAFPAFEFEIGRNDVRRFARAIGETDPVYFDVAAARAAGHPDLLAPPYFPYALRNQAAHLVDRGAIAADGSALADVPPLPTKRAMAGETEIELGPPIHAGDKLTLEKRIADLFEKEGRSGPLVFVKTEFTFRNENGTAVFSERFTRIYR